MTCWRESPIRRIGEADKMTCKQKRPEREALSGTSCDRGRYGDGYGDVSATISATSHRCGVIHKSFSTPNATMFASHFVVLPNTSHIGRPVGRSISLF